MGRIVIVNLKVLCNVSSNKHKSVYFAMNENA